MIPAADVETLFSESRKAKVDDNKAYAVQVNIVPAKKAVKGDTMVLRFSRYLLNMAISFIPLLFSFILVQTY